MWWILGGVALIAIVAALVRMHSARRSEKVAWDSLTREEQGIVMRNSQPGTYGSHESTKAKASGPRNNENHSGW